MVPPTWSAPSPPLPLSIRLFCDSPRVVLGPPESRSDGRLIKNIDFWVTSGIYCRGFSGRAEWDSILNWFRVKCENHWSAKQSPSLKNRFHYCPSFLDCQGLSSLCSRGEGLSSPPAHVASCSMRYFTDHDTCLSCHMSVSSSWARSSSDSPFVPYLAEGLVQSRVY